ncbi:MAG: hypothetical protein KQH53_08500 [Desulfarculaceae bacterium]|nr:hypothetical protein [Desulfarculaceae bacterium]
MMTKKNGLLIIFTLLLALGAGSALADHPVVPYNQGHPIAFPVVTTWVEPPLVMAKPVNPVYVPTLPGLLAGKPAVNFMGGKIPKHDGLTIKQSKVAGGKVTIPVGGFVFKWDTTRGILPVVGSTEYVFGPENLWYYVDYPGAVIVKATNVTLKRGEKKVVGDNVFHYLSATGHGCFRNPVVDLRTESGVAWDFVGMAPATFTVGLTKQDPGKDLHYGYPAGSKPGGPQEAVLLDYNQLFASRDKISGKQITLDTIYSTDLQTWTMSPTLAFKGRVADGKTVKAGAYQVQVTEAKATPDKQSAKVRLLKDGKELAAKTLVWRPKADRYLSPYNVKWQKNVLLKHDGVIVHLLAAHYPKMSNPVNAQGAELAVYTDCIEVSDGKPCPWDKRFALDFQQCPQGHGFGTVFWNTMPIVLDAKNPVFKGPAGYLSLVIDKIEGDQVTFHLATAKGKSLEFTKTGNVDLILGQGRAQKDLIRDLNHATEREMYRQLEKSRAK